MFRQDVNLYKEYNEPAGPTAFLAWKYYWLSIIVIVMLFAGVYVYSLWQLHTLKYQATQLNATASQLQKELIELKGRFPQVFFSGDTQATINKLHADIQTQQKLMETTKTQFFSTNLRDFSILIAPNVWLTKFIIDHNQNSIVLTGKSTSKEELQKFINNLGQNKNYDNYQIGLQNVENVAKQINETNLQFDIEMIKKP